MHQTSNLLTKKVAVFSVFLTLILFANTIAASTPEKIGSWDNVTGFAINSKENYIVLSITIIGKNQLFESSLINGQWTELKAIDAINTNYGDGFDISGPSLSFDGNLLLFQADFPDTKGGFDIYCSEKDGNTWGAPKNLGSSVNTAANEMHPSITPGLDRLFFSRDKGEIEFKKPKDTPNCQMLFFSVKDPKGLWEVAVPLHEQINRGCEHSGRIAIDGRSLYFSSVDPITYKEGYNVYFTQEILKDNWLIPQKVLEAVPDETKILPQFVNGNIYYLKRTVVKKQPIGSIFKIAAPENTIPFKTITTKGKIVSQADKKPIEAELTVFDPTTLKILGVFKSDKTSGEYELPLLDGKNYIVDIRKQGYSFASFQLDYRQDEKVLSPQKTELFQNIELVLSVYDNEIFRPLEAEVFAESTTDKGKKFDGKMISPGTFSFTIPMGEMYTITAKANWFDQNTFEFNLNGDIVFSKFERYLPLSPRKKPFEIKISDKDTEEGVVAEVMITNLNREETIFFSAQDVKDGKITAMLREGDQYEFTIRGAQGYSFHNQVVDFAKEDTRSLNAELVSLKAQTSIRLNNINFGSNSAELSAESFPELNRVVQLIKDNPNIVIEIAAHTDNVGSPSYNLILSEKRAQSVVNYLFDNAVPTERLVAKGYGLNKPMVPNTSDENKALNRRVEFNIVDILTDAK